MNLLRDAQKKRYAVAHFNVINMEVVKAIAESAQKLKAPVIFATSESAIKYCGYEFLSHMFKAAVEEYNIKAVLHGDHLHELTTIKKCIDFGWDSVMIDASMYSFQKNVVLTKKVVQLAKKKKVLVEAEVGQLGENNITNPKEAEHFVNLTRVDSLAIAIGTSHGAYKFKGKPKLHFNALNEIRERVNVPLVLHGASGVYPSIIKQLKRYGVNLKNTQGVPDKDIKKAIKLGICKINVGTDTRLSFLLGVKSFLHHHKDDIYLNDYLGYAKEQVKKMAEHKIKLFGSDHRV